MSKVAVIDDDASVRELCRTVLIHEGFQVVEAVDARSGILLVAKERPDLVLLDVMMPEVDGMEVLRALKSDPDLSQIPIIMLTALDGVGQISLASTAGADGYVTKPFEVEDLLSLVRRFTALAAA
jgi:DNA-binding response OmpR family regulator